MAELVTGHAGKAHATAEQAAGLNAGILGLDDYVLNVHDKFEITVVSANKVTIGTGELVMQGRHVSQGTPEDLIVTNGSQGQKRNDLIVCRYAKGSQNIESAKLVVVRGTPTTGTPTDPAVNTTSPLDGGTTYDMPLYRIPLDGITIGTPVALFNVLKPMSDVWDSLTQRIRFDRSGATSVGDEMYLNGAILPGSPAIAVISIVWFNRGAFGTRSWTPILLARMVGWKVTGAAVHAPCAENINYSDLGANMFTVGTTGEINYLTPGNMNIGAGSWHRGCLIAPVVPA